MPSSRILHLEEIIEILRSPDSKRPVKMTRRLLTDGENSYPIIAGKPILFPNELREHYKEGKIQIPYELRSTPLYQYFLISQIKAYGGSPNAQPDEESYLAHAEWSRSLLKDARGLVLDIGCDDPILSASLLPDGTSYIGLDPLSHEGDVFRVLGVGEFLPFVDGSFDSALFLTSLDHIFDWHRGLEEAFRVLKKGGTLYLSSLIWSESASLLPDTVHFHHFREFEIIGGLRDRGFSVEYTVRYPWKSDLHRKVLQLKARKPAN